MNLTLVTYGNDIMVYDNDKYQCTVSASKFLKFIKQTENIIERPTFDSVSASKFLKFIKQTENIIERPTFDSIHMAYAFSLSTRSTCKRLSVGCVITSADNTRVLGIGYNGNAHGLPNTCDSDEVGKCGCIHAEENAVIHCTEPRETPKVVYCTHLPCVACAKRIIQLGGVKKVVYDIEYRDKSSIDILNQVGIKVERI